MSEQIYLILGATGRQGSAVVDTLITKNVSIVASSRNPLSLSKQRGKTIKTVKADMNDVNSIVAAIDESKATRVWFTTDWYSIENATRAKEAQLGYNVIDAVKIKSSQVQHVVYNSGAYASEAPENIPEMHSKVDIEAYMERELLGCSTTWSVLQPAIFLENIDDPKNGNPLKKGSIKMLTKPDITLPFIGCPDIGKGSAELLMNPGVYSSKKVVAATCEYNGLQLAQILSEVSGTKCTYSVSVPRFVLWMFVKNLYHLITWFESTDSYENNHIEAFRKIVPDYQDAKDWFAMKGSWDNGEKFEVTASAH